MFDAVLNTIEQLQGALFQGAVEPALYHLGLIDWSEDLYDGIGFAMFGAVEIALAFLLFRGLELWRPVERWGERRAVRTDVVYTLVHRLGIVPAVLFLLLAPIRATIDGYLRFKGYIPPTLATTIPVLPGWALLTSLL